jgi:hypothetical protein
MTKLTRSMAPAGLARVAFRLYERFRPAIPEGEAGWGAKGVLDLNRMRRASSLIESGYSRCLMGAQLDHEI